MRERDRETGREIAREVMARKAMDFIGDTPSFDFADWIEEMIAHGCIAAIAQERDACAKVVEGGFSPGDEHADGMASTGWMDATHAKRIRARGKDGADE